MTIKIVQGDALAVLKNLKSDCINSCITSPPYWGLRDYGVSGQLGLEPSPDLYVQNLVCVFREVRRALKPDGVCWIVIGDCYAGSGKGGNPGNSAHQKQHTNYGSLSVRDRKQTTALAPKQLVGIPWRLAFALQDDGWWLRSAIVWAKPNGMPGSQQDRCSSSHEMIFMLTKSAHYWSNFDAIKTPLRESTLVRLAQDVQAQAGSHRANAGSKTNGPMKAASGAKSDKQRGHGRQHAGFNERWDAMKKSEQQSRPAMMRDVWFIAPKGFKEAHFAVFPEELARRCAIAGCPEQGVLLDPFAGSGTVGLVVNKLNRHAILIELNPDYVEMAKRRCNVV